jgi:small subunit ribosomal protein S20
MPITKSAKKSLRQSIKHRENNLKTKDVVKESVKIVRRLVKAGKKTEAAEALKSAMSALDKAVKKNVIHKNNAARRKSRLAKAIAK